MKDIFLNVLSNFGMEGLGIDEREVTLEDEMKAEIAMEAELDEAYSQMEFAGIVQATSEVEAVLSVMAAREVGLESNEGRDAATIYGEFGFEGIGMEAVKDVVARKAYSGLASIKSLINKLITWLKGLVGITVASKKVFTGLKNKAKAMRKLLSKGQSKVNEKLKRDMPDYNKALKAALAKYKEFLDKSKNDQTNITENLVLSLNKSLPTLVEKTKTKIEELDKVDDELTDIYDKGDTDEYEGNACYKHVVDFVTTLESEANSFKTDDIVKNFDKQIKAWEKLRKDLDKKDASGNNKYPNPDALSKVIQVKISYFSKLSLKSKKTLKLVVKIADDGLTAAKGVYAAVV